MIKRIEIRFRLTRQEYLIASMPGGLLRSLLFSAGVMIAVGVPLTFWLTRDAPDPWMRLLLPAMAVAVGLAIPFLTRAQCMRRYRDDSTISAYTVYWLDDAGVSLDNGHVQHTSAWSDILDVTGRDGLLRLRTRYATIHIIPERAIGSRQQIEACREFVAGKVKRCRFGPIVMEGAAALRNEEAADQMPALVAERIAPPRLPDVTRSAGLALIFGGGCALLFALTGVPHLFKPGPPPHILLPITLGLCALFSAAALPAGVLILRGRHGARRITFRLLPVMLVAVPMGPLIVPFVLWALLHRESKRFFTGIANSPPVPAALATGGSQSTPAGPAESDMIGAEFSGHLTADELTLISSRTAAGAPWPLSSPYFYATLISGTILVPHFTSTNNRSLLWSIGTVIAIFAVIAGLSMLVRRLQRSASEKTRYVRYRVTDAGIESANETVQQLVQWSVLRRAQTLRDVVIVFNTADQPAVILPTRHFKDAHQLEAFKTLLRANVPDCASL